MPNQKQDQLVILRRKQVELLTGLSRSSIYSYMATGTFPKPIKIGLRMVGWIDSEISNWIDNQLEQSRKNKGVNHEG